MRNRLIRKAIRQRFAVNMPTGEAFNGILVDADKQWLVFEDCKTIPDKPGETPTPLLGRVWVKHDVSPAPYLQEVLA